MPYLFAASPFSASSWHLKAGYAAVSGAASSGAGMLTSDIVDNGRLDYSGGDYLRGMATGGAIAGSYSIGASAYQHATWGRFSTDQKIAKLRAEFGEDIQHQNLNDYARTNLRTGRVEIDDKALSSRALARNVILHEIQHVQDAATYRTGGYTLKELEHRAHLADIKAAPRQFVPSRYVDESRYVLYNDYGYTGNAPHPRLINYLFNMY